jgi:cell wall-associated NlpC family hydrolase
MVTPLAPDWAAPFVGAPYRDLGEDPAGWDCWGLARFIGRELLGWTLPDFPNAAAWETASVSLACRRDVVETATRHGWRRLECARPDRPAVALMVRGKRALRHHCGIADGLGYVLHVTRPLATVYWPLEHPELPRLVGYYEPK